MKEPREPRELILLGTVDGNDVSDFYKLFTTFLLEFVSESAIIPRMMRAQGRSARNGRADRNKTKEE